MERSQIVKFAHFREFWSGMILYSFSKKGCAKAQHEKGSARE